MDLPENPSENFSEKGIETLIARLTPRSSDESEVACAGDGCCTGETPRPPLIPAQPDSHDVVVVHWCAGCCPKQRMHTWHPLLQSPPGCAN